MAGFIFLGKDFFRRDPPWGESRETFDLPVCVNIFTGTRYMLQDKISSVFPINLKMRFVQSEKVQTAVY